jgi:hypothetical protein
METLKLKQEWSMEINLLTQSDLGGVGKQRVFDK